MDHGELVVMIKDFIAEQKEANKDNLRCLNLWKNRMTKLESDFENCSGNRVVCTNIHTDIEARMRSVEKLMPLMEKIPEKMDHLAIKVYTSMGIMTVLLILAGVWLKAT